MKILLLDLDGTVRETMSGAKFINDPCDQKLVEGVEEAIAHYSSRDWLLVGITNQGGVAANHKSLEDAKKEQRITLDLIPELLHIYFCPDYEGLECWKITRDEHFDTQICQASQEEFGSFRKPGCGMLKLALSPYKTPLECWFIGDREEDALAAAGAGTNFMWADVWRDRFKRGFSSLDLSSRHISREILLKFLAT